MNLIFPFIFQYRLLNKNPQRAALAADIGQNDRAGIGFCLYWPIRFGRVSSFKWLLEKIRVYASYVVLNIFKGFKA